MFEAFARKFYSFAVLTALLLSLQIGLPSLAQASELSVGQALLFSYQGLGGQTIATPGLMAAATISAPAMDEVIPADAEETAEAAAKKVKEAEKAAKKAAKAEAKKLEEIEDAAKESAKAEAKAAKKAAKEAAKKAKAAAKAAIEASEIAPGSDTPMADGTKAALTAEDFASMTPEQKKQYFMVKGSAFKPTPEAISDKVSRVMQMKGVPMPPDLSEKINAKMKAKAGVMPAPDPAQPQD